MKKRKPLQGLRVVFIGAGNVGTHLSQAFKDAGATIVQMVTGTSAAKSKTSGKVKNGADLYVIAVPDDAIEKAAKLIPENEGIVVHTSGSVPMNVLHKFKSFGVFYPLQTFSKARKITINAFPICIEGSSPEAVEELMECAGGLSKHAYLINSEERAVIHLAAVFANNFSNHMFANAEKLLRKNHLPFDILRPLILETAFKVTEMNPAEAQTGPALRKDKKTLARHTDMLKKHPALKKLYKSISEGIAG